MVEKTVGNHVINRKGNCNKIDSGNYEHSSQLTNDSLKKYISALRPWSFSASLTPVMLGTAMGWKETGQLNVLSAIFACVSVIAVHGAGNLVNTYHDYLRGIDSEESDDRTLVNKILTPEDVVKFGVIIYVIGCVCFLGIVLTSPCRIDHLALLFFAGVSGSFLYTGSIGLKYHALGDVVIFLTFGPISVLYSYIVQSGHLAVFPLMYALPLVMNTEAILHGNNTRDIKSDLKAGVLTVAIVLGFKLSYLLYFILIFVPYGVMLVLSIRESVWFVLPILTIKVALSLEKDFRFRKLSMIAQDTAKLNLLFGILYVLAFIMKQDVM